MKKFNGFMVFVILMAALLAKKTEAKSLGAAKVYKPDKISGNYETVVGKILCDRFPLHSDDQIQEAGPLHFMHKMLLNGFWYLCMIFIMVHPNPAFAMLFLYRFLYQIS